MDITTAMLLQWLRRSAAAIRAQREYLTELDAAIGDADHGFNLDRGFAAVVESLPSLEGCDSGMVLKSAGMRLISTVGGASGPLYGTAFRRAGQALEGRTALSAQDVREGLQAFVSGVANLGKAVPGDKTMLDALMPALARLNAELDHDAGLDQALRAAAEAARLGAEATIPLVARRGRASYLGERSVGHQDPGATSAAIILQALADVLP
jgi:phosphoenolpyruvate---glycerone phosphotransferase subunit DhaL